MRHRRVDPKSGIRPTADCLAHKESSKSPFCGFFVLYFFLKLRRALPHANARTKRNCSRGLPPPFYLYLYFSLTLHFRHPPRKERERESPLYLAKFDSPTRSDLTYDRFLSLLSSFTFFLSFSLLPVRSLRSFCFHYASAFIILLFNGLWTIRNVDFFELWSLHQMHGSPPFLHNFTQLRKSLYSIS